MKSTQCHVPIPVLKVGAGGNAEMSADTREGDGDHAEEASAEQIEPATVEVRQKARATNYRLARILTEVGDLGGGDEVVNVAVGTGRDGIECETLIFRPRSWS
jgi:hypothetical protein